MTQPCVPARAAGISGSRLGLIAVRIGNVVSQDRAFTLDVLLALLDMYEEEWQVHKYLIPKKAICTCMFLACE